MRSFRFVSTTGTRVPLAHSTLGALRIQTVRCVGNTPSDGVEVVERDAWFCRHVSANGVPYPPSISGLLSAVQVRFPTLTSSVWLTAAAMDRHGCVYTVPQPIGIALNAWPCTSAQKLVHPVPPSTEDDRVAGRTAASNEEPNGPHPAAAGGAGGDRARSHAEGVLLYNAAETSWPSKDFRFRGVSELPSSVTTTGALSVISGACCASTATGGSLPQTADGDAKRACRYVTLFGEEWAPHVGAQWIVSTARARPEAQLTTVCQSATDVVDEVLLVSAAQAKAIYGIEWTDAEIAAMVSEGWASRTMVLSASQPLTRADLVVRCDLGRPAPASDTVSKSAHWKATVLLAACPKWLRLSLSATHNINGDEYYVTTRCALRVHLIRQLLIDQGASILRSVNDSTQRDMYGSLAAEHVLSKSASSSSSNDSRLGGRADIPTESRVPPVAPAEESGNEKRKNENFSTGVALSTFLDTLSSSLFHRDLQDRMQRIAAFLPQKPAVYWRLMHGWVMPTTLSVYDVSLLPPTSPAVVYVSTDDVESQILRSLMPKPIFLAPLALTNLNLDDPSLDAHPLMQAAASPLAERRQCEESELFAFRFKESLLEQRLMKTWMLQAADPLLPTGL